MPGRLFEEQATRPLRALGPRARVAVAAYLVVQLLFPTAALIHRGIRDGTRPMTQYPLSWQMYSAVERESYSGTTGEGETRAVPLDGVPVVVRSANYGDVVQERLCRLHPDLVVVWRDGDAPGERVRC